MPKELQDLRDSIIRSLTGLALDGSDVKTKTELFFWIQRIQEKHDQALTQFYKV